ncbi:MAG: hypothetical protein AB7L65_00325, partial [Hyphomonadaceae bacterium]
GAQRETLEAVFHRKEFVVALLILGAGIAYFPLLFALRAVPVAEVRAAFRREPDLARGAGLPAGFDG